MLPENWNNLTPDEKFEERFSNWLSTANKQFVKPEIAKAYERRAKRFYQVIKLQQPDCIPCIFSVGSFVAGYAGASFGDFFYNYKKAAEAFKKFYTDFDIDYQVSGNFFPGKSLEVLDYRLYTWPKEGQIKDRPFQCREKEYMMADEYDALIANPELFLLQTYLSRICGALGGLNMLPSFLGSTELFFLPFMLAPFGLPAMKDALKAISESSQAALEFLDASGKIGSWAIGTKGIARTIGGGTKAPFDYVGDTLRGTRGIMLDMFRQPAKVIEACERLVPGAINMAVNGANASGVPIVLVPLHKGADDFMSNKDFERFYWPSLKAVILGIIRQGIVPYMFVEGSYNQRLDIIAQSGLPAGKTAWLFDRTDMVKAKEKFGKWACIGGNVPASLFTTATPQQVKDAVKKLIDTVAPGGGYFISPGAVIDEAQPANVHAYIKAAKEYGVY
jgi:hypothetical protein